MFSACVTWQLLLGYLSLTARTLQAQCAAMRQAISRRTNEREGQLDEVKEDFLAEKIKWMADVNKTKEDLQAQKVQEKWNFVERCVCDFKIWTDLQSVL